MTGLSYRLHRSVLQSVRLTSILPLAVSNTYLTYTVSLNEEHAAALISFLGLRIMWYQERKGQRFRDFWSPISYRPNFWGKGWKKDDLSNLSIHSLISSWRISGWIGWETLKDMALKVWDKSKAEKEGLLIL